MTGMMPELVGQAKREDVSREYLEERPPGPPHVRPDSLPAEPDHIPTVEGLKDLVGVEDLAGVGTTVMGKLNLGSRGLAVGILMLAALGLFIRVQRLRGAKARKKA